METGAISWATLQATALKGCSYHKMWCVYSVPAPFCSEETETGGSAWMVPALDWARRWWRMGGCHWPGNLSREKAQPRPFPFNDDLRTFQKLHKFLSIILISPTHPWNSTFVRTFLKIMQPAKMFSLPMWIPHCVVCTHTHLHKQCLAWAGLTCGCGPEFNPSPHGMRALQGAGPRRALFRRSSEPTQGGRCKRTAQVRSERGRQRALWGPANGAGKDWDWGFHQECRPWTHWIFSAWSYF